MDVEKLFVAISKLWKTPGGKILIGGIAFLLGFQGDFGYELRWILRLALELGGISLVVWGIHLQYTKQRKKVFFIGLILLVAIAGTNDILLESGRINESLFKGPLTPVPTATETIPTVASPTYTITATPLNTPSPTSSPTHTSTTTLTPTKTPTSTPDPNLLFNEDFNFQETIHWNLGPFSTNVSYGITFVENKALRIEANFIREDIKWVRLYADVSEASYIQATHFVLSVDAKLIQAVPEDETAITVHFRINENFDSYYLMLLPSQEYSFSVRDDTHTVSIISPTKNTDLNSLELGNHIEIRAVGSVFTILANGIEIANFSDPNNTLTSPGGFALGTKSSAGSYVIVDFDNLIVSNKIP